MKEYKKRNGRKSLLKWIQANTNTCTQHKWINNNGPQLTENYKMNEKSLDCELMENRVECHVLGIYKHEYQNAYANACACGIRSIVLFCIECATWHSPGFFFCCCCKLQNAKMWWISKWEKHWHLHFGKKDAEPEINPPRSWIWIQFFIHNIIDIFKMYCQFFSSLYHAFGLINASISSLIWKSIYNQANTIHFSIIA